MAVRFRLSTLIIGTLALSITLAVAIAVAFSITGKGEDAVQLVKVDITVEEVINRVETQRRRPPNLAGTFTPALVGEKLIPGDGVKTYSGSEERIDITFKTASRITRTTPNTTWRLGNFGVQDATIIDLAEGKIFLLEDATGGESRPIKIVTPAGTASPRGTWLSVQYHAKDGVTEVQCFRGICELENQFGKQIMADEEKSAATATTAPTRPVLMTESELMEFAGLPEAQSGEITIPPVKVVPIRTVSESIPAETLSGEPTAKQAQLPLPVAAAASPEPASAVKPAPIPVPTPAPDPTSTLAPNPTQVRLPLPAPIPQITPVPVPLPTAAAAPAPTLAPVPLPEVVSDALPQVLLVTVTVNGAPAPDGTLVTAWMKAFREPLAQSMLVDGRSLLMVPQYGSTPFTGETMSFKIGELDAGETAIWQPGGADLLNLTAVD